MSRFSVTYRIFAADLQEAKQRAENIALEQTVEIPRDIVPKGYIEDEILGKVEEVGQESEGTFKAIISYSPDSVGDELAQLNNVIFGNSSIQTGLKVIDLDLGETLANRFKGPRFGIKGLRQQLGRPKGGMISPVIKPQGSSVEDLARIAYLCALAGADIIKDDHGLTNQHMAPFKQRVEAISKAVAKANAETGGNALYFPNIAGHMGEIDAFAKFAKEAGVGGLLIMPGHFGFAAIDHLARSPDLDLPIMAHPAFLGPYVLSEQLGFTHAMMFGTLQRLAGTDISVFPNVGGRFGFTKEQCQSIARACTEEDGIGQAMLPSPGGGMSVERAADMAGMYGDDVVYLLGGSLLRYQDKIGEGIREMRAALETA
jgi:ribulose-bisphosphate carboxylase large chain